MIQSKARFNEVEKGTLFYVSNLMRYGVGVRSGNHVVLVIFDVIAESLDFFF